MTNQIKDDLVDAPEMIEEILLRTDWVEEAQQIPIEYLPVEEQILVQKCINKEEFTDMERDKLAGILGRFREHINKIDPEGIIDTYKENVQLVEDEKTFLQLIDQYDEIQTITMYYPIGEQEAKIVLDVFPLTDSQAILSIQENLSLFKDLTENEKTVYNKRQTGQKLTIEEEQIMQHVEKKIEEATQDNQIEIICEFLALQTKFHGKDSTYDEMMNVYKHMKPAYLALLFQKVQDMQNMDSLDLERVFRESD